MRTRLTPMGELAYRFGVQTPAGFWSDLYKEIERIADQDGDWQQMLEERIEGMRCLREGGYYAIAAGRSAFEQEPPERRRR